VSNDEDDGKHETAAHDAQYDANANDEQYPACDLKKYNFKQ